MNFVIAELKSLNFAPNLVDLQSQISNLKMEIQTKDKKIKEQVESKMIELDKYTEVVNENSINTKKLQLDYQTKIETLNEQLTEAKSVTNARIREQAKSLVDDAKRKHGVLTKELINMQTVTEQNIFI